MNEGESGGYLLREGQLDWKNREQVNRYAKNILARLVGEELANPIPNFEVLRQSPDTIDGKIDRLRVVTSHEENDAFLEEMLGRPLTGGEKFRNRFISLGSSGLYTPMTKVTGNHEEHGCVAVMATKGRDATLLHELKHAADRIVYGKSNIKPILGTMTSQYALASMSADALVMAIGVANEVKDIPWSTEAMIGLWGIALMLKLGMVKNAMQYSNNIWERRARSTEKRLQRE